VVEITDYSFFTTEPILGDFENLNILCLRAGDLSRLIRPHSLFLTKEHLFYFVLIETK
jgi:hypothetical protein